MGSDPVIPECNSPVVPFDTDLQVLAVGDVLFGLRSVSSSSYYSSQIEVPGSYLKEQLQQSVRLLLFQPVNLLRESRVYIQRFLPRRGMDPHNGML